MRGLAQSRPAVFYRGLAESVGALSAGALITAVNPAGAGPYRRNELTLPRFYAPKCFAEALLRERRC